MGARLSKSLDQVNESTTCRATEQVTDRKEMEAEDRKSICRPVVVIRGGVGAGRDRDTRNKAKAAD